MTPPTGMNIGAAGALSPEAQSQALENVLAIQAAPSKVALNQAQARHLNELGTFEQNAGLQLLNTILGIQGRQGRAPARVALNVNEKGEATSPRDRHYWTVDPYSGERLAYIGPVTSPAPQGADRKTTGSDLDAFFRYRAPSYWNEAMTPRTPTESARGILSELTDPVTGTIRPERFLARLSPESRSVLIQELLQTFPESPIAQNLSRLYGNQKNQVAEVSSVGELSGMPVGSRFYVTGQPDKVYIWTGYDNKGKPTYEEWTP